MSSLSPPIARPVGTGSRSREVVAATIGTFFEWYDLLIYGTFAVVISRQFFPAADPDVGLFLGLLTFASAYLVRPLGAILIGGYADRPTRTWRNRIRVTARSTPACSSRRRGLLSSLPRRSASG